MLLMIVELVLVVLVWLRGWRWWSLLPIPCAMVGGFVAGLAGISPNSPFFILFDIAASVAWFVMLFLWPKPLPRPGQFLKVVTETPPAAYGEATLPFQGTKRFRIYNVSTSSLAVGDEVQVVGRRGFKSTLKVVKHGQVELADQAE